MSGAPETDPVTGYETTGHDWNGIRELNSPLPRVVLWSLILGAVYCVVSWVLLPTWPLGRDYTRGLLGIDQTAQARADHALIAAGRDGWEARFAGGDFDALAADDRLMALVRPAAARLFADNCAACHGEGGQGRDGRGGTGFPSLADGDWLWYPDPADIAEVLRVGINSDHPDTFYAQMPAFGRDGMLERAEIDLLAAHVAALPSGAADPDDPAAMLFADNCAGCHGDGGTGGLGSGAPSLTDAGWIYGGGESAIRATLTDGRAGVMPAWEGRLSPAEINLLALYVADLGGAP